MNRIGIMQITDSLAIGGLERMAVNLANNLPPEHYHSHLCVTRASGPLVDSISGNVKQIHLERTGRYDVGALWRLVKYVRENQIQILHAHGTSLFIATLASRFKPKPVVIWHDNFGRCSTEERASWSYGSAAKRLDGVIAANQLLAEWSNKRLRVPQEKVWYIPNFVSEPAFDGKIPELPGEKGSRIVCVANLRPQKDHFNLFHAMKMVLRAIPKAHLLLLGSGSDKRHLEALQEAISVQRLTRHVTWLGARTDVFAVLRGCDVGVLSSMSEGLPLALLEYGLAGLPAVSTNVGQCEEVLDEGRAGILVPPKSPVALSDGIVSLLKSTEHRTARAEQFSQRVRQAYSSDAVVRKVCKVYEAVMTSSPNGSLKPSASAAGNAEKCA